MSITARKSVASTSECEGMMELRKGPWSIEEDTLLIHCIACHGEGRWNLLARSSGLKRTGKSCRLRWLNYLKPDIKRGNLSLEEQLIILDLHSKWGNRWSRIAQHLPGRTDNEIKNYWRTRVQRQARQLKVDANSASSCWVPRLLREDSSSPAQYRVPSVQNFSSIPPPHMFDEMPPRASDELRGVANFTDPLVIPSGGGGHCTMNDAYEVDPWNLAPTSVSITPTCSASDHHTSCSKNDVTDHSLWSTGELYEMLKSYTSGAESEVPFGDDNLYI